MTEQGNSMRQTDDALTIGSLMRRVSDQEIEIRDLKERLAGALGFLSDGNVIDMVQDGNVWTQRPTDWN